MKTEKNMRNKMGVRCAFLVPNCDCSGIILVEGQISHKLSLYLREYCRVGNILGIYCITGRDLWLRNAGKWN